MIFVTRIVKCQLELLHSVHATDSYSWFCENNFQLQAFQIIYAVNSQ